EHRGVGAQVGDRGGRLGERGRREVAEARQPHHGLADSSGCRATGGGPERSRRFGSLIALPSPPSHGGGTISGSGHGTAGKSSGPTRRDAARSPASTLSGVIGTSSTRTRIASYTALATAGGIANSGPCPTSLAPNGPSGSGFPLT